MPETVFKSWIIKILSAFSITAISLITWFLIRTINSYDQGINNQETIKSSLNDLKGGIIEMKGDIRNLKTTVEFNARMEEAHYKEVQQLQRKIYNQQ